MPRIIGLSGYARSGKDTAADFLSDRRAYTKLAFADEIRDTLYDINPFIDYDGYYVPLKDAVDAVGWEELKSTTEDGTLVSKSLRPLLQTFGSVARGRWGEDFWIRALLPKIQGKTVIADVRFLNEAEAIKEAGGVIWRIEREGLIPSEHPSERGLDGYDFDLVIHNNSTLVALYEQIERAL